MTFVCGFPRESVFILDLVLFPARWVKVTVAVGEESEEAAAARPRLATDTDVLTLEQPGRVTG